MPGPDPNGSGLASQPSGPSTARKTFLKLHRWLGLLSGLVVLIVCATAVPMAFQEEINRVVHSDWFTEPETGAILPVSELIASAETTLDSLTVSSITLYGESRRPALASSRSSEGSLRVYVNVTDGRVIDVYNSSNGWYMTLFRIHRGFVAGDIGRALVGWSTVLFVIILISGIPIWWPKRYKGRTFKDALTMNYRTKNVKRWLSDFHKVWGFYSVFILLVLALTGLPFGFSWASSAAYWIGGGERSESAPTVEAQPEVVKVSMDVIAASAAEVFPDAERMTYYPPSAEERPWRVRAYNPGRLYDGASDTAYLDPVTASLIRLDTFAETPGGTKARRLVMPIHDGSIGGIWGKIIAAFASFLGVVFPITGVIMWYPKWKMRRKRKAQRKEAEANGPAGSNGSRSGPQPSRSAKPSPMRPHPGIPTRPAE